MALELSQEGIPILGGAAYPEPLRNEPALTDDLLLEELVHARHSPLHEGIRPRYGCLIVADLADLPAGVLDPHHLVTDPAAHLTLRPLVDGHHTVVVRDLAGRAGVAITPVEGELDVVDLIRTWKAVSIQRLADGRIRVGTEAGVALADGGDWSLRPSTGAVMRDLLHQLNLPGDDRMQRFAHLRSLLEFCFHALSPNGIGATLVVSLDKDCSALLHGASDTGQSPPLAINVFERDEQQYFLNLLAANDGACFTDPDGQLRHYTVKLKATERAMELMSEMGGTRHTSSKRFSFDHPGALVVVVSADGPVTLFCAGAKVGRLTSARSDDGTSWIANTPSSVRLTLGTSWHHLECPRCQTPHLVGVTAPEPNPARQDATSTPREPIQAACAACGTTLGSFESAVHVEVRIRMPWVAEPPTDGSPS
ncbi:MAG: diadenylate cyclase [Acidimicrobiales bacterium]|nr:diadenylate cyclase [Acidimicrobiales bacterium]